ncbi:DUF6044 family protein [Bacillus pacificus]
MAAVIFSPMNLENTICLQKKSNKRLRNAELNIEHFKKMDGRYILSAVPIENAAENNLSLEKNIYIKHIRLENSFI